MEKSREGRQNGSFVPGGTLEICEPRVPAINGWAIFKGARSAAVPGRSKERTAMRLGYFDDGLAGNVAAPGTGALRAPCRVGAAHDAWR